MKVRLMKYGTEIHCNTHGMRVLKGGHYIIRTEKGLVEGTIISEPVRLPKEKSSFSKRAIVAPVSGGNPERLVRVRAEEQRALQLAVQRIRERELKMKLVKVIYQLDLRKAVFYFTADGRIDFRGLVKDLAATLKTRVEMRQIGVRDEARMMGGVGPCGQELCCNSFLEDFEPVSIKMAKEQDLSLNPTKISGICGRLMCCLAYEHREYEAVRKSMPKCGRKVCLKAGGEAKVRKYNILRRTAMVEMPDGKNVEVPFEEIQRDVCPKAEPEEAAPREEAVESEDLKALEDRDEPRASEEFEEAEGPDAP